VIQLPTHDNAGQLALDIAGQYLLEADARRQNLKCERRFVNGVLSYQFAVGIPGQSDERQLRVEFDPSRKNPSVFADGPECLRHRWPDRSLCMWDPQAPPYERWVVEDGLPELAQHARLHLHCEAECRAGRPWPKLEMAGEHPRKRSCPSCRGQGR
jgi:hypothetical protein